VSFSPYRTMRVGTKQVLTCQRLYGRTLPANMHIGQGGLCSSARGSAALCTIADCRLQIADCHVLHTISAVRHASSTQLPRSTTMAPSRTFHTGQTGSKRRRFNLSRRCFIQRCPDRWYTARGPYKLHPCLTTTAMARHQSVRRPRSTPH
jgi:hypothetical protein